MATNGRIPKRQRDHLIAAMADREAYLRAQIAERREALAQLAVASQFSGDQADLAVDRTCAGIDCELIDRHLREIVEIEQARARCAADAYGTCADCGDDIGWPRLQANPLARRCADCQSRREKLYRGNAHVLRGRS